VKAVLAEIPYGRDLFGPLHTCGDIAVDTTLGAHWGVVTAGGGITGLTAASVGTSIPRDPPPIPRLERFWTSDPTAFGEYEDDYGAPAAVVPDPWLRVIAADLIEPVSTFVSPPPPYPDPTAGDLCCDHSNLFESQGSLVECPVYDYDFWKRLASSREAGMHYYLPWGSGFREDGLPPTISFETATDGREGLFFFDTANGRAPHDLDGDGVDENLSPDLVVSGSWTAGGFIYLHARRLTLALDPPTREVAFVPPGEPFLDLDHDGVRDDPGEPWINLEYPTSLGDAFSIHATDAFGGGYLWNPRGKPLVDSRASFHGILYSAGLVEASGQGVHYGSVITREGLVLGASAELFWDASIGSDWPPAGMAIPRVTITGWDTQP
jgi:hypothetical protein